MLFITITFRLIHASNSIRSQLLDEIMLSITQLPVTRGCRLIITDDFDTAVIQAKHKANNKTQVVMIDLNSKDSKTKVFQNVSIIPYLNRRINLSDEISRITSVWR